MDEKTLLKIEFDRVLQMLGERCGSSLGKGIAGELTPMSQKHEIELGLKETTEAKDILRLNPAFTLGGIRDIGRIVERAALGGILEPEQFLSIADTCGAARKTKLFLLNLKENYPIILDLAKKLGIFKSLETAVGETVADDGSIIDSASDKLYGIRRKIRTSQDRIKDKLDSLIRNPNTAKYLQDNLVTIRGDRYVIPVKQENRTQVPGIVHDQSASGATLFIEPMAVLELNNDLKRLRIEENDEITVILKNLSQLVASFEAEILFTLEILGQLDFIFAKGRLSHSMDGGAPKINEHGIIRLKRARHPLIPKDVVPIDVDLGSNIDSMIITGPNTGGKTVTLKTIGLFTAMALSGLHVPADDGSDLSLFHNIFADIGDEQSIEQSLSTFSSHLVNIVRILKEVDEHTLVLFDELGAGTDPTEGAALAMAILEYLRGRKVKVVATTHYSELKVYAYNNPNIVNASVEFNVETLRPTYRLLMGIPGKSNAFEIARSLGLNEEILAQAGSFLTQDQVQVADLISNLELNQKISQQEKEEAAALRKELQVMKHRLEAQKIDLQNKEGEILRRAQEESLKILKKTKDDMDLLYNEFKSSLVAESQKFENQKLLQSKDKIKKMGEGLEYVVPEKRFAGQAPQKVELGQIIEIPKLNQKGQVLSLPNQAGEIIVQVGIMKITVKLEDIRTTEETEQKTGTTKVGRIRMEKISAISSELDLRGLLVEEALEKVDKYLDDAYVAGLKDVRIIHGKGTGALRDAVTLHLKKHRQVKNARLGEYNEGGNGVTVVSLNV
ncbi:endonuclease MutS2 [Dehalobacterium formicoaceticum]|uniref:Endonuclease MutS2 n=1 Tax=Dehalobacterium formicoaceticum TaxID=51515 RepID=A0ABT1YA63_9FIRM|nr:endonuclease MutS2 [Dehalobacterium formicoaceticum]MCR6546819.1 endonuclease MutS2 [Dehalobacterium formicoaceticum]